MNKVACSIAMSLDAFVAGPNMSFEKPFGDMPEDALHHWMFDEPEKHRAELDALNDAGAFIMGSNMYGPKDRRESADTWKGWWGDNPPYHTAVFVLSHHERKPVEMEGGTIFHFVTDGIGAALARAREAANGKDVRLGGGVAAIRQFLQAALIDQLHIAIAPILLGSGEHLFHGLDLPALGYRCKEHVASENATHIVLGKS